MAEFITLTPFRREDQQAVRSLILAGMAEHWGAVDESLNPDLNDIAGSYAGAVFLVARQGQRVVGTGALASGLDGTAEVKRMSVAADLRRQGLGKRILTALIEQARARGCRRVILETTSTWTEVIEFYLDYGFRVTHTCEGDTYFIFELKGSSGSD